ncbi:winged helix-turn-helix domain-containing protein [Lacrimispora brassicae]
MARIRAFSWRSDSLRTSDTVCVASLCLDMRSWEVSAGRSKTKLTVTEAQLLELLMGNQGQVLTKEQILDRIGGFAKEFEKTVHTIQRFGYQQYFYRSWIAGVHRAYQPFERTTIYYDNPLCNRLGICRKLAVIQSGHSPYTRGLAETAFLCGSAHYFFKISLLPVLLPFSQ